MYLKFYLLIFLGLFINIIDTAKILIISPSLSKSMLMFTGRIADILVESGHNVTFWIPELLAENNINGTKLAKIVRMSNITESFKMSIQAQGDVFEDNFSSVFTNRIREDNSFVDFCEEIMARKSELEELKNENFDLAFTDLIDMCLPGVVHYLNISKHIWISTGDLPDAVYFINGISQLYSYMPSLQDNFLGPKMNFMERVLNFIMYSFTRLTLSIQFSKQNEIFKKYVSPNFPLLEKLFYESALIFTAGDEFINPTTPTLNKVINIGGIGIEKPNPLKKDLEKLLKKGVKGAILFSLGSAVSTDTLNPIKKAELFKAFANFPDYQFIVKVERKDFLSKKLAINITNVDLVNWIPQSDLLGYSKLKLFISHAGYNSIVESVIRGVPMLCIPLFFDQFKNAKAAEYRNFAISLKKSQLNEKNISLAIREILQNPKYKNGAMRLAKLFATKPNRPRENLISWTNFVLENGPLPELIPEGVNLPWYAYYSIDVMAFLITLLFLSIYLPFLLLRYMFRKCKNLFGKIKMD